MKNYKTAVGYLRVSSIEQGNIGTSLESQKQSIIRFCIDRQIQLEKIYVETFSGKNFNRPEFEKAFKFLRTNKGKIDLFLTMKVDRFTRDVKSGLQTFDEIKELGVEVNFVDEWLENVDSSGGRMAMTFKIAFAEYERMRINERTRQGERMAMTEGRYIKTPPKGYSRGTLPNGKKFIVPNKYADLIYKLFDDYSTGIYTQHELIKKYEKLGLKLSKSSISRVLENILYTGYIDLKKHNMPPYTLIKGLHEAIVPEYLFNKAQNIKTGKNTKPLKIRQRNPDFPLNTFLYCSNCGCPMRGSSSTNGKNKNPYQFYRCAKNCGEAYKPSEVHSALTESLKNIKPSKGVIDLFKCILTEEYDNYSSDRIKMQKTIDIKIEDIEKQKMSLTDKYINGKIDDEMYQKFNENLSIGLIDLKNQKEDYKDYLEDLDRYISFGLTLFKNLDIFYEKASIEVKVKLLGSYFTDKLYFEKNSLRTPQFNHAITLLCKYNKGFQRLENKKGDSFSRVSRSVPRVGIEPTHRSTRV